MFADSLLEKHRHLLANSLFTMMHGMRAGDWFTLLRHHRREVSPRRLPRMLFMTAMSLLNSLAARIENRVFGERVAATKVGSPLFILGHWRSGTTLLHNLMACDPQFSTPTLLQTLYPHAFLTLERPLSLFRGLLPRTRLLDNIQFGFDQPQEDEFALCNATLLSPYMGWIFPQHQDYYDRYLTLEKVSPEEVRLWREGFMCFLQKVAWRTGRRLLLKSPTHTARIRLLLSLFPDAVFVHISRHPYAVFQSTKHLHQVMFRTTSIQQADGVELDELVLQRYELLYKHFLADEQLIPRGRICEIRFEELESEPLATLEALYRELGLDGFEEARPQLLRYLASAKGYRKNCFPTPRKGLCAEIGQRWNFAFDRWSYAEGVSEAQLRHS